MSLIKKTNVVLATTARVASSSNLTKVVDMMGYNGCMFIVHGTTLMDGTTGGSTATNKKVVFMIKGAPASSGPFVRNVGSVASSSGLAQGTDNRLLIADVYKPTDRYLKGVVYGASSAVSVQGVIAVQYDPMQPGNANLQNSTTISGSTLMVSPTSS